jgi:hypothetical protein
LAALKRRKGDFQKGNFESDLSKFWCSELYFTKF